MHKPHAKQVQSHPLKKSSGHCVYCIYSHGDLHHYFKRKFYRKTSSLLALPAKTILGMIISHSGKEGSLTFKVFGLRDLQKKKNPKLMFA